MSRIGKSPISIPEGVKVQLDDNLMKVSGDKGMQSWFIHDNIKADRIITEGTDIIIVVV